MSRYHHNLSRRDVNYDVIHGYDKPIQEYFLQVYKEGDDDDEPWLDEGSVTTKRSNGYMINLYELWEVDKKHIEMLINDLPF